MNRFYVTGGFRHLAVICAGGGGETFFAAGKLTPPKDTARSVTDLKKINYVMN